jgi:hypothetical protein
MNEFALEVPVGKDDKSACANARSFSLTVP